MNSVRSYTQKLSRTFQSHSPLAAPFSPATHLSAAHPHDRSHANLSANSATHHVIPLSPIPLSFNHLATQLPLFGWAASFRIVLVVSPNPRVPRSCHCNPTVVSQPHTFLQYPFFSTTAPASFLYSFRFPSPSLTLSHPLSLSATLSHFASPSLTWHPHDHLAN
jgi:hypothetical protein